MTSAQTRFTAIDPARLQGPRVRLRPWQPDDLAPFAAMSADAQTMAYFLSTMDRAESELMAQRCQALIDAQGWGFWAVELAGAGADGPFIGLCGMNRPAWPLPFAPCVEIGWRLARPWWGQGLAAEAAALALDVGFAELGLDEIVAFTAVDNRRSRALMERLGMARDEAEDFDHPAVPDGHPLKRHVLYRLPRRDWTRTQP
ncbi:RimJ/RimL family protein N-acetyltransferase [Pseudacidovorax intermedius]|uniref:RimJ/RimL family protein N-acetyltransferase n=1 Tax=Pseudacidovorax intermedius TaxID=433924 RepID=A0A370F2J1_9BURK|nr:GNAT family N-acetyltransferase [Pseudacidovorax intermedius]RDI16871.1 RimJ/RimL family protein N-acetyltransferase [Pseudacidovorax intermedius]